MVLDRWAEKSEITSTNYIEQPLLPLSRQYYFVTFFQAKEGTCEDYTQGGPEGSMGSFNHSAPEPTPSPAVLSDIPVTEGELGAGRTTRLLGLSYSGAQGCWPFTYQISTPRLAY